MIKIESGVVHKLPKDLKNLLTKNNRILEVWNGLTPLARNEWICWITFVKKTETREKHLKRFVEEINEGKRRPCCWAGCPHRK